MPDHQRDGAQQRHQQTQHQHAPQELAAHEYRAAGFALVAADPGPPAASLTRAVSSAPVRRPVPMPGSASRSSPAPAEASASCWCDRYPPSTLPARGPPGSPAAPARRAASPAEAAGPQTDSVPRRACCRPAAADRPPAATPPPTARDAGLGRRRRGGGRLDARRVDRHCRWRWRWWWRRGSGQRRDRRGRRGWWCGDDRRCRGTAILGVPHDQPGDRHHIARLQHRLAHGDAVDLDAVLAAQIAHHDAAGGFQELGVMPRQGRIVRTDLATGSRPTLTVPASGTSRSLPPSLTISFLRTPTVMRSLLPLSTPGP